MALVLKGVAASCAVIVVSYAQSFTSLLSFIGPNGSRPNSVSLAQGIDGNLYGTTQFGGADGLGTVFLISPAGVLTTIHSFGGTDGANPFSGLVLGTDGNFYGTTANGGAYNKGTVYKITSSGTLTTLYSFCAQNGCADGATPYGGLEQFAGAFYGTAMYGGTSANCPPDGCGAVFKITSGGVLTILHSFAGAPADGMAPYAAPIQATNGNFYGTTSLGGANNSGTVYEITSAGVLTILHSFNAADGFNLTAGLFLGADGALYGTAAGGGQYGEGTVFKIVPSGKFRTLYSFCLQNACGDGAVPLGGVIQATDGSFYGTTYQGGTSDGTIYRITSSGALASLHSFHVTDGLRPMCLAQATNGLIYGLTQYGGSATDGTVFTLSRGLSAFVETVPVSGRVGIKVMILGTDLTGATSVTFNGVAAKFSVVSATEITTTVPAGATTGQVQVVTPAGTLSGNIVFRVR